MEKIPGSAQAAFMEQGGHGQFVVNGKTLEFRTTDGRLWASWSSSSPGDARTLMLLFRASVKYFDKPDTLGGILCRFNLESSNV